MSGIPMARAYQSMNVYLARVLARLSKPKRVRGRGGACVPGPTNVDKKLATK